MKNNGGFSLVELIVVIAIMAILAGVAVPTYTKYIEKANDAKVMAELDEIKTAAIAAGAMESVNITKITVTDDAVMAKTNLNPTAGVSDDVFKNFTDLMGTTEVKVDLSNTSFSAGATWENGEWK